MSKDGGPAFPAEIDLEHYHCPSTRHETGMSLRDYFAAAALTVAWENAGPEWINQRVPASALAFMAYEIADAMLERKDI